MSPVLRIYKNDKLTTCVDVLKFEYLTQLLLDSNYIPLILKLFLHRDVDEAVAQKIDRSHFE